MTFAKENKLALTNTFFSTRKRGVSHTFNIISSRDDQKRIGCIIPQQAHRCRVYDAKLYPQPPPQANANLDHNIVYATVRLSGRYAPNTRVRKIKQIWPFDRQMSRSDEDCRQRGGEQIFSKNTSLPSQPSSTSEMAESLVEVVLDAVANDSPSSPRRAHNSGGASPQKPQQPSK